MAKRKPTEKKVVDPDTWKKDYLEKSDKAGFFARFRLKELQLRLLALASHVKTHPDYRASSKNKVKVSISIFRHYVKTDADDLIVDYLRDHYDTLIAANNKIEDLKSSWGGRFIAWGATLGGGYSFLCPWLLEPVFGIPCIDLGLQSNENQEFYNYGLILFIAGLFGIIVIYFIDRKRAQSREDSSEKNSASKEPVLEENRKSTTQDENLQQMKDSIERIAAKVTSIEASSVQQRTEEVELTLLNLNRELNTQYDRLASMERRYRRAYEARLELELYYGESWRYLDRRQDIWMGYIRSLVLPIFILAIGITLLSLGHYELSSYLLGLDLGIIVIVLGRNFLDKLLDL